MSEWKNLLPARDLDLSQDEDVFRSRRHHHPLDEVELEMTEELYPRLFRPFTPHPNLATPNLCDLKEGCHVQKKFLDRKNPHPWDDRIIAVESPHTYFLDGSCDDICSSTQMVHAFFPDFDSEGMAKRTCLSKSFQTRHRPSHKYHGCETYQDVLKVWNRARDLGTALHDNIECYLNGEEFELDEDNKSSFQEFLKFSQDKYFWKFEHFRTEWAIFDPETRICGKIDYIGRNPATGHFVILDWKRVENISDCSFSRMQRKGAENGFGPCSNMENCKYITYSLQLNLYKWILEKNYGIYVSQMFLIQLHPKLKNVVVFKVPNLQKTILKMAACRKAAMGGP
jgi:hypothetical protein